MKLIIIVLAFLITQQYTLVAGKKAKVAKKAAAAVAEKTADAGPVLSETVKKMIADIDAGKWISP